MHHYIVITIKGERKGAFVAFHANKLVQHLKTSVSVWSDKRLKRYEPCIRVSLARLAHCLTRR